MSTTTKHAYTVRATETSFSWRLSVGRSRQHCAHKRCPWVSLSSYQALVQSLWPDPSEDPRHDCELEGPTGPS